MSQKALKDEQKNALVKYLGDSISTRKFIVEVDELLGINSSPLTDLEEKMMVDSYKRLKEIIGKVDDIVTLLDVTKYQESIEITDQNLSEKIDQIVLKRLVNGLLSDNPRLGQKEILNLTDHNLKVLADLGQRLQKFSADLKFTYKSRLEEYAPKTKGASTRRGWIGRNVMFSFIKCFARLPVMTDGSDDEIAFRIVYEAFGVHLSDFSKIYKKLVRHTRKQRGLTGKGKYKVKL